MRQNVMNRQRFRLVYLCFLAVYMAVREVTPLQFLIDSTILSGIVFASGFSLVLWDLFTERECLRGKEVWLLILFVLVCVVSSLVNIRFGVGGNLKAVGALILEYFLLFPAGIGVQTSKIRQELCVLSIVLCIVWSVLTFLSVHMYVFDIEYTVDGASQGFHTQYLRLWGVFQDPSYAAFISLITMAACIYLMICYQKPLMYGIGGMYVLLQLGCVVLGGSRSAFVLMVAVAFLLGVYLFVLHGARWHINRFRGVLLALGGTALSLLLIVSMQYMLPLYRRAVRMVFPQTSGVYAVYDALYGMTDAKRVQTIPSDAEQPLDFIHRTDTEKEDVSNGRFIRWRDTLTIFLKAPLLGTSPRNVSAVAKVVAPDTLMAKYGIAPHNGYLDVLVGVGVIGFMVLMAFLVMALVTLCKVLRKPPTPERVFVAVSVFLLAGSAVFLSDIFFFFTAGAVLFWLMLGYALHTDMPQTEPILFRKLEKQKGRNV